MSQIISTASVAVADRNAFWAELVCETYVELECEPGRDVGVLEGELVADAVATLQLSRVSGNAQTVRRTPAKIARSSQDYLLVSLQTMGHGVISQDGRQACLKPGDFALYDSTRPYALNFDGDFQQYVLRVPGPVLRSSLRNMERLTATAIVGNRGAGHLLVSMIRTLAADVETLAPASACAVAHGVTQLLVAGLSELPSAQVAAASSLTKLYRQQIRSAVDMHLRDPEFSVGVLAQLLRVSSSTLQRAWSAEGCTLHDYIWTRRLEGARRELVDPSLRSRSVSEIAFAWGFNDAAHFSRAFRARFAAAPRDIRPPIVH